MIKTKLLVTGFSGMVGSRILSVTRDTFIMEDFSQNDQIDITDFESVQKQISSSDASYMLHLAAKVNPDDCEKDKIELESLKPDLINENNEINVDKIKHENWRGKSSAFAVNVVGTKNIADACRKTGKQLIYISTDYVFNGNSKENLTEQSKPNPVNYYGWTKYWAEEVVKDELPDNHIIVRIASPYGATHSKRFDVVTRMRQLFEAHQTIHAIQDQLITPTFIDDIAKSLELLIKKERRGIFHVVGSQTLSPFELSIAIAEIFNYDKHLIMPVPFNTYYTNRAPRPQFLMLSNDKLKDLGFTPLSFKEGLSKIKNSL